MTLSNAQFERVRGLACRLAGIELAERHQVLLARRCGRIGIRDAGALEALLDAVGNGEQAATEQLLALLTTKFTGFFRHPRHFELAAERAVGAVRQRGRARLWSAAASTGEEPYSLAMAAVEAFGTVVPPVSILATDLDVNALAFARRAEYTELAMKTMDPVRRERFFRKAGSGQHWELAPEVRGLVEFRPFNLVRPELAAPGPFDVIFCRNVLMYLQARHRCAVLERMAAGLAEDGLLLLDPTENLGGAGTFFTTKGDGVYSPRRDAPGTLEVPL